MSLNIILIFIFMVIILGDSNGRSNVFCRGHFMLSQLISWSSVILSQQSASNLTSREGWPMCQL